MANELIRPAKQALAQKYGYKNVSVKNGRGTAWGWVEANIYMDRPQNCTGDNPFYCSNCRETLNNVYTEAHKIMADAWVKAGLRPYTYYADDGYNTANSSVLVQASFRVS